MGYDGQYFWVVLCKNHKFHKRENLFFEHKIPLGETDAIQPPPVVNGGLSVRCDDCGHEYTYQSKDLLRIELDVPEPFKPHPLFV
jgi:hypothetical protein